MVFLLTLGYVALACVAGVVAIAVMLVSSREPSRDTEAMKPDKQMLKEMTLCATYGGDPKSVARRMGLTEAEANDIVAKWKAA